MKKLHLLTGTILYSAFSYGQYFEAPKSLTVGDNPLTVEVVDFNGDGLLDILTPNHDDRTITININNGDRTYTDTTFYTTTEGINCIATGDLNNDNKVDVVLGSDWENQMSFFTGNGINCDDEHLIIQTLGYFPSENPLAIGDVDNDGNDDIVFILQDINNYYKIHLYQGDGAGAFLSITKSSLINTFGKNKMTLADFNNDGYLDVAQITVAVGGIDIYLFNPISKQFDFSESYEVYGSTKKRIIHGDFNGDTKTDLAVSSSAEASFSIIYGNNDGTFSNAKDIITSTPNFGNEGITALNLNNDSYSDFICVSEDNDSILLFLSNNLGDYSESVLTTLSDGITNIASADVDNDGYLDLIIPNSLNDKVDILYGKEYSNPTEIDKIDEHNNIIISQLSENIKISGVDEGAYLVTITAIDGKILVSKQISTSNNQMTITPNLQTGRYVITIKGNGIVESKKIIIW